jgi:hypothetical protein
VRLEFRKSSGPAGRTEHREAEAAIEPAAPPSATELWLLKLILLHEDQAGWLAEHLDLAWIQHPGVRQVLTRRLDAHARAEWTGAAGLLSELNDAGLRSLVSQVLAEARPIPRPEEQLRDIVLRFRNQALEREIAALLAQTGSPSTVEAEHVGLLQRMQELRRSKSQPLAPLHESPGSPSSSCENEVEAE